MRKYFFSLLILYSFFSCKKNPNSSYSISINKTVKTIPINKNGNTIKTRFNLPFGYSRVETKLNTFQNYLQNFKLKPVHSKVHLYNGNLKNKQHIHASILDISVGKRDLQQCADATMRLRAEFLFAQKRFNDIHFKFTNGFNVAYSKWRQGYRLKVKGNQVSWYKTNKESSNLIST